MCDDSSVGFGRSVVKCHRWDRSENRIKPHSSNWCVSGLSVDTTFEFHAGHHRHKDSVIERGNLGGYGRVAIAQVNRDVRVKEVSHASKTCSFWNVFFIPHLNVWRHREFAQTRDHFGDRCRGGVNRHHIAGTNDYQFHVFTECNVPR